MAAMMKLPKKPEILKPALKNNFAALAALALFALAGCFTVHESIPPPAEPVAAPQGKDVRVALAGFEATFTTYTPIRTYTTAWGHGGFYRHGRYYREGAYPTTVTSTTYIPETNRTTAFVERAQDILETSGFIISSTNADYIVEVRFSGPVVTNGDRTREALCIVFSLLTADYAAESWSARLTVREAAGGRLLHRRDFTERASAAVWGPLPIFSPAAADDTSSPVLKMRALSALTDLAVADATAFLAKQQ